MLQTGFIDSVTNGTDSHKAIISLAPMALLTLLGLFVIMLSSAFLWALLLPGIE